MLLTAVGVLVVLALLDLWVGVTNDAINFLNSAIGSHVAKRRTIYIVATAGIMAGALLSDGMMEVARKGIFDPGFFKTADGGYDIAVILKIYLAVMLTDIILLDLFNTFGLPTSTTVSIVSELVGASLGAALFFGSSGYSAMFEVLQSDKVVEIYTSILLSVVITFSMAAIIMFAVRNLFGRDTEKTFKYFGGLWTGVCMSSLLYFVLFKALKHVGFIAADTIAFLKANVGYVMAVVFAASFVWAQFIAKSPKKVFGFIILFGTGSLAAAFAGNDLVNFIGPTLAGAQAVFIPNVDLAGKVHTPSWALLLSGVVMTLALWRSKKANTVSDTEVRLAGHSNVEQRFSTSSMARLVIAIFSGLFGLLKFLTPMSMRRGIDRRTAPAVLKEGVTPPYDLLRATVNLCVASIVISIGTANKLPLSTTYVTFIAAMGAALADRSWGGMESAQTRVTGVLVVMGGWLVTGVIAAAGSFVMATILMNTGIGIGLLILVPTAAFLWWRLARLHTAKFGDRENVTDVLQKTVG